MAKFTALWNYQRKKTGEIVIAEEELQKMLDAAWDAGYNEGRAGTIPRLTPQPLPHTPTCTLSLIHIFSDVEQGYIVDLKH